MSTGFLGEQTYFSMKLVIKNNVPLKLITYIRKINNLVTFRTIRYVINAIIIGKRNA